MYVYQADVWCDECADQIKAHLDKVGKTPPTPHDPTSFDSDRYPKFAGDGGESDTPDHCGSGKDCRCYHELPSGRRIGKLLGGKLTRHGVEYVREAVARGGEVAELWGRIFADQLGDRPHAFGCTTSRALGGPGTPGSC